MQYDKELIAHKLDRWDRFITDYHLPEWDSIPDLGLYMDQLVGDQFFVILHTACLRKDVFLYNIRISVQLQEKLVINRLTCLN